MFNVNWLLVFVSSIDSSLLLLRYVVSPRLIRRFSHFDTATVQHHHCGSRMIFFFWKEMMGKTDSFFKIWVGSRWSFVIWSKSKTDNVKTATII